MSKLTLEEVKEALNVEFITIDSSGDDPEVEGFKALLAYISINEAGQSKITYKILSYKDENSWDFNNIENAISGYNAC